MGLRLLSKFAMLVYNIIKYKPCQTINTLKNYAFFKCFYTFFVATLIRIFNRFFAFQMIKFLPYLTLDF